MPETSDMSTSPTYVLDGSNVCQWSRGRLSLSPLLACLLALTRRGESWFCYFDANILHVLGERAEVGEQQVLESMIATSREMFCVVTGGIQADPFVLQDADKTNAKIISNDQYTKYQHRYPWLAARDSGRLLKGSVVRDVVTIPDLELYEPLQSVDTLRDLLAGLAADPGHRSPTTMSRILPAETGAIKSIEARLIVFALDASGSMCNAHEGACATFDGRRKSDHLKEILRGTIERLARSAAGDSFYISMLSFAGAVALLPIDNSSMAHITRAVRHVSEPRFDYLSGSSGIGTNLSLALKSAVGTIDDALNDSSSKALASVWHALIILVTDGKDTVDLKAVYAEAATIATQRAGLTDKTVRLAVVAIGDDCQMKLLADIATEADDSTLRRLEMNGLAKYVVTPDGSHRPRLLLHVDAKDVNYCDVIRTFIDLVSHTH